MMSAFQFLKIPLLLALAGSVFAAEFVPPAEGPVAFRRDRVPLDAETMLSLASQMTTLARGMDAETPRHRQAAARMLALAMALDPTSSDARALVAEYEAGHHQPMTAGIDKSHPLIWQYIDWLESKEAGADGHALAACLNDVMAISDSTHPRAQALRSSGEKGAWHDWVADLAAFKEATVAHVDPEKTPPVDNTKSAILLAKASLITPLWNPPTKTTNGSWALGAASLEMNATELKAPPGGGRPFTLLIGNAGENGPLASLVPPITRLLTTTHGPLPKNCRINIGGDSLEASLLSKKRHSLSAAAAVLASSALTGREPQATIIGAVDEKGAFKLPVGFWDQLQSLHNGRGSRLVLPAAAADYLSSMLALERPEFFLDYEVLLARDFKDLLDLTAMTPPDPLAKVSQQFAEIRSKTGSMPINQYVANTFVRRRLAEISAAAPYHASAKMLAIQGSGNRPTYIRRDVLAAELRRAVEPVEWIMKQTALSFDASHLELVGQTFEDVRAKVDHLARYADKSDRELIDHTQEMVNAIRTLDRGLRARPDVYAGISPAVGAFAALTKAYTANSQELATESGEPEPVLPH